MDDRLLIPPFLIALNTSLKLIGMPSSFAVAVDWAGGVVLNFLLFYGKKPNVVIFMEGFILGCTAAGLYDGTKAILKREEVIGDTNKTSK